MSSAFTEADERWLAGSVGSTRAGLLDGPVTLPLGDRTVGTERRHALLHHLAVYGPRPDARGRGGDALLWAVEEVDLTGRGGGHFPVAAKWRAALDAGGGGLVVANCAEGEPASAKDATLLQLRPHLVLDGLALAAETLGSRQAVVWLHQGDSAAIGAVRAALAERRAVLGHAMEGLDIRVALGPDRYLTGESSAVVSALSGGPALPFLARRPAAVQGVGGRPTVIHNAETLARVALLARSGADPELDGPLLTVVGPDRRAVVPAQPGETFDRLVRRSGVVPHQPAAVLLGGYGGQWSTWSELAPLEVSQAAARSVGRSLGAGVVAPIGPGVCGLSETARVMAYLAESSARQCGPCLFGLPDLAGLTVRLADGRAGPGDVRRLVRLAAQVSGRGACHHPDGAVQLLRSALLTFEPDVRHHLARGRCAGADRPPTLPLPAMG
jgi:NADH:ubiquinone oxidoreductase subunit F (NADH-binding)